MSTLSKIARRGFLIGSSAIAGGFAFGVYKLQEPAQNPLNTQISLNAFVVINQDGITLVAPKAEMGQGVHTSWAALIAEELDVTLEQVKIIHGPPAKAYFNSALFGLSLPFLDYEVGSSEEALREFMGNGAKLVGLQLTGGSTSMRDGFERMRMAGATAREMLKEAAAKRWELRKRDLKTRNGQVIAPDGQVLSYMELAEDAAQISPPHVKLKDRAEWTIIGQTQQRVDMLEKVTGAPVYGSDIQMEGMLYAAIRQSPMRNGKSGFDASKAASMRGVVKVIDLGETVAVLATNTWNAMQAARALEVDWSPAKYAATTEEMFDEVAQGFEQEPNTTARDDGDVDQSFSGQLIEAEYRLPILAHTCMETMSAAALYSGEELTVWCGNQAPLSTQSACAEAVGIAPEQVTLNTLYMGGGFGRRSETDYATLAARIAKEVPDTPIQMQWSREEDLLGDVYRPATIGRFRGAVRDGQIAMLDGQISGASIAQESRYRSSGERSEMPDREHVSGAYDQPYNIPNYRIRGYVKPTELPIGYWRSVGTSFNVFYFESFIDELAHEAGRDPLEFRYDMIKTVHVPSAAVLAKVREMSSWDQPLKDNRGRGVAFSYTFGSPMAQVVEVEDVDGQIHIRDVFIACDVGVAIDPGNIEAQVTGGCIYGLSAAVMEEITLKDAIVQQSNFHDYEALRMHNSPRFHVEILESNNYIGGIGECGTALAAPALTNAVFDLTGKRARRLPLIRDFDMQI